MELRQLIAESHVVDLLDGSWGEPVSTRLFPRKNLLVDDHDIKAFFGEPVSSSSSGWASADDQNVVVIAHDVKFMMSSHCRGAMVA